MGEKPKMPGRDTEINKILADIDETVKDEGVAERYDALVNEKRKKTKPPEKDTEEMEIEVDTGEYKNQFEKISKFDIRCPPTLVEDAVSAEVIKINDADVTVMLKDEGDNDLLSMTMTDKQWGKLLNFPYGPYSTIKVQRNSGEIEKDWRIVWYDPIRDEIELEKLIAADKPGSQVKQSKYKRVELKTFLNWQQD